MKHILAITLGLVVLSGCSSTTTMSLNEKNNAYSKFVMDESLSSEDKVDGFKFSGWTSLSDNYLIITAKHNKDYLVETNGRCIDLNKSADIKLNRSSNLAIYKSIDSISTSNQMTGECFIKSIYPITTVQTDDLTSIG
ncbi:DUF6491 family protein [uncultured Psychrosphaera sp.]|jgi:hypothetical protein|uniref:DUF6491 family protein n=1 Tax=uncultured Psychrosphaera sp. TaxID=1403522 RepID=UPI00261F2696|nr:DUF6491 family protein [uncultured Psychrosphaera sp.]